MRKTLSLIVIVLLASGCSGSAPPDESTHSEWFLIVAEGLPDELLETVGSEFQKLVGVTALPGDMVHVIAAPSHRPVASFTVPSGSRNARLRDSSIRSDLAKVKTLFESSSESWGDQLQLPALASTVRSLRDTDFTPRVILVGNPIYQDSKQSGWSMSGGIVPSDGALASSATPFYSAGSEFSDGTTISWLVPVADWGVDQPHRNAVTRFWRLFIQQRGATLTRLTVDSSTAFSGGRMQFEGQLEARNDGVRVLQISGEATRDDAPPVKRKVDVDVAPVTIIPPPQQTPRSMAEQAIAEAERTKDHIVLAINWTSEHPACDIDMWVRSAGASDELYYGNRQTSFGTLYRDVRSSGSISGDGDDYENWECVRIEHNRAEDLTLWLNVFSTRGPATVRVIGVWNGRRRERTVHLPVSQGDGAVGSNDRESSVYWRRIGLRTRSKAETRSINRSSNTNALFQQHNTHNWKSHAKSI